MLCVALDQISVIQWTWLADANIILGPEHCTTMKHIFKYLRRTRLYMLIYGGSDLIPVGYTDSDSNFMSNMDSRKSTFGYVFTLKGAIVNWRSIKQQCIADSTTKVEYVTAIEAAKEAIQLRKFLLELCVVPQTQLPIILCCYNNWSITQSKDPMNHKGGKHI